MAAGRRRFVHRRSSLDLIGHCAMLLAAGYETAVAIANLVLFADATTDEHADGIPVSVLKQLYEDWALLPGAIEETLRFYPPYPASRRKVVADTELGGQAVNAGSWVVGWLTSANRDPDLFPNPSRFDIRRWPNEHLTFGDGRRRYLGAPLARLELTIVLQVLLERLPGFVGTEPSH